ncbi:LRRN4 C-terminal-like protein [Sceloporus undulatus]|uniref:LRRN4 C-terminal-like protein n=1 Tax=Sceloporus undulatus TaxID=8520 RepID=UPI001C4D9CDA|nr:LRRN4 C-terminal-like protein [Sceloporus undulatus]XP_042295160.1 LRRN4 C-terminal-like protein [Sceloporus undulatus]
MSIPAFFLVVSWTLTLWPQGSPTSLGHPLPTPLKENHIFLPASGSNIPAMNKGQTSPPAHIKMPQDHSDDDYYDYGSILTEEPKRPDHPQLLPPRCNYNHCHHLQVPCMELSKVSQCMCPGITDPTVAPEPPRLQTIHVSEAGASVHWCAPSSTVQEYRLWYRPVNGPFISGPALNSTFRLAAVSDLLPGQEYLFCVVAYNQAGSSPTDNGFQERGPCRLVWTPSHQISYAYIAVGLACTLIVVVISILVWYFCYHKKKRVYHGSLHNILDGEPGLSGVANTSF